MQSVKRTSINRGGVAILSLMLSITFMFTATKVYAQTFGLTILHNNDAESQLINAGGGLEDFGGVARFKTLVDTLKAQAVSSGRGVIMLSSGDNFLAGPEFNASLQLPPGQPFYDAVAVDLIGYDALAIGNHEFDFGPDVLARFISDVSTTQPPFLSANLDFSGEDTLQALVNTGRIASRTVLSVSGEQVGIIGATTPDLPNISSPRNVIVDPDVAGIVQMEIDALEASGVNKIILISHLQSITEELNLATQLSGVDIIIAGGGAELLANPGNLLTPGDSSQIFGPYPLIATDADSNDVPVVVTNGDYRYVGRLSVEFDANGDIVSIDTSSGPVRVPGGTNPDSVTPNPDVQTMVVDPVVQAIAALAANVVGTSQVVLDGLRSSVRTEETNLGNLIADALLWQGQELAGVFGVDTPKVALQNGGGIRNNSEIPAGDITELATFDILPFTNFVTIIPDIPPTQFKEILENAVSQVENTGGRFAQVGGFAMTWDPNGTAQVLDPNGNPTTAGTRVVEVTLDDGTAIVENGMVAAGAPSLDIATIDFLARGGDQYPYRGAAFTSIGVTYQRALANYITQLPSSEITAAAYPVGGEGRITQLPPISVADTGVCYATLGAMGPNAGSLITIDLATGAGTIVGPSGLTAVPSLAIKSTGEMFATDFPSPGSLYRIDAATGATTLIGSTGLFSPHALAFDGNDVLYAIDSNNDLYIVDELTGATTLVGPVGVSIKGIEVDPTTGILWGGQGGPPGNNDGIYTINTTTGAATLVGNTGLGSNTPALHFDQAGNLYGPMGGGGNPNNLVSIDKATGVGTIIGPIGFVAVSGMSTRVTRVVVGVDEPQEGIPQVYQLAQNYPNPFNPSTVIEYALPEDSRVRLEVYNILGQRVATLVDETQSAGYYSERFDATGLASGLYFYHLQSGDFVGTKKLLLLK